MNKDLIIVALDFPSAEEALALVDQLGTEAVYYKVGLELFLNSKGSIISALKERGKKVFLDLKFHDIPNTVAAAARWATGLGIDLFNVHALGGEKMMKQAKEESVALAERLGVAAPQLIGVTILTSMNEEELRHVGVDKAPLDAVEDLATLVQKAGLEGVVCSPREVPLLREKFGPDFVTVCPGIRPLWASKGDQSRIMTPKDAVQAGVTHMVIGRPITKAENPLEAIKKIWQEINE